MNPQPKPNRIKDEAYLAWIRTQPCIKCGSIPAEPHHTETGGMGMKGSDRATVPLCRSCHIRHDSTGKKTFWLTWNLKEIIKRLNEKYDNRYFAICSGCGNKTFSLIRNTCKVCGESNLFIKDGEI